METMLAKILNEKAPPNSNKVFEGWQKAANNFREENILGTWTLEQLIQMQKEFNSLPASNDKQRQMLLFGFFNANIILHIIIGELSLISEYAEHHDACAAQFNLLHRAELMSQNLNQFSDLHFGPPSMIKRQPKYDEHVKAFEYSKLPAPYQHRYTKEPKLTAIIESSEDEYHQFEIHIQHLVKTEGFCRCIKLHHRETLHSIPLKKIVSIQMVPNTIGVYDLHLEIMK